MKKYFIILAVFFVTSCSNKPVYKAFNSKERKQEIGKKAIKNYFEKQKKDSI